MNENIEKKTYSKSNTKTSMSNNDYIQILNFYKIPIPKSKKMLHLEAEKF